MHRFTAPKNDAFYMIFSSRFKGESKVIQLNEFFWKKKKINQINDSLYGD